MLIDVVLEVWDPRWPLHSLIFLAFFFLKYAGSAAKIMKVKSLSLVRPFAIPRTVAYQALPSMGFSRQEYWSGLPFPSPAKIIGDYKTVW